SPEKGAEKIFSDFGCKIVFVTCGKDGCVFKNGLACGSVPGVSGLDTVDSTGAGDIFGGSAMFKILSSGKAPEDLAETDLREICTFACVSAGLSTAKFGGIESVPSLEEILNFKGE
ncbi:MAG: carbohydrate kinase, partial [Oscillospiraceae bacterium]|nr:carbohydrate kinase [Oscillospiraceae bacterium]